MTWQTALLVLAVVLWAAAQYGLAMHALLDLRRRPTVRGNNKVVWTLVILGIPIAGALIYTVYGPTSFIRRGPALDPAQSAFDGSGPDNRPDDHLPSGGTEWRRHEPRVNRSATRVRQHPPPIELLPEIPELTDIDGEIDEAHPEADRRGSANRLVRQAQRRVRR